MGNPLELRSLSLAMNINHTQNKCTLYYLTRCDMREWPPTSIPICYQPQHPQRETDNTDK